MLLNQSALRHDLVVGTKAPHVSFSFPSVIPRRLPAASYVNLCLSPTACIVSQIYGLAMYSIFMNQRRCLELRFYCPSVSPRPPPTTSLLVPNHIGYRSRKVPVPELLLSFSSAIPGFFPSRGQNLLSPRLFVAQCEAILGTASQCPTVRARHLAILHFKHLTKQVEHRNSTHSSSTAATMPSTTRTRPRLQARRIVMTFPRDFITIPVTRNNTK